MKNKLSNKIQEAWASFFENTAFDDLDVFKADGWKTIEEIASQSKKSVSTVHSRIRRSPDFEWKTITAPNHSGVARRVTIARPKLKG